MSKSLARPRSTREHVPLGKMKVLEIAQRRRDEAWINHLLADFDIDQIGTPIVSKRGGFFNIIDGQHRIAALKEWLGEGSEGQQVECKVYHGLSDDQEAELFLRYNDVRQVRKFDKFKVGVTAGRPDEVAIAAIVEQQGLKISSAKSDGSIGAVATLCTIFKRGGAEVLERTLVIIRDAYGDSGFEAAVINGVAHVCQRYADSLDQAYTIERLRTARGGVKGLVNKAAELRERTGNSMPICVAAAVVSTLNSGRGGKKLPPWWAENNG